MNDLAERLQRALGADYEIERELGGGMSRVFVARDTRLDRRVVVKVLPPELASGVNLERFQREIRLAAQLQHPHIVPMLFAGAADGVPFYVMPFVEGESLRARIERERELPVADAVRLLREVLDALTFAHDHGVVHRDIKPDNILLTGRHAVVTDFGVAKAILDATGEGKLTSTGVAVGTPAYMAPEQVAAEPNVDHRADIYAVGALAFEMLAGLPPFRGATAQAILAAHLTQAAPAVSSLRPSIPAALDATVARCLAKHPADRFQTTHEVIASLDALVAELASTAGLVARTPSPGSRGAPLLHVATWFGVASAAVLAVTWGLIWGLGLPDWVFPGAIALLAAGLPIMLATSWHEHRRAQATRVVSPDAFARLFTWGRAIQGGVVAFVTLGLAVTLFMTSRALGIGPGKTLVSSGMLNVRDRLLIAEFDNRTSDTSLALTVSQLLRIDLAQSPVLRIVEPAQVAEVLVRMRRDRSTPLTADVAREIATREGIKAYLTGEALPAGAGVVIAARLVNVATGDAVISLRQNIAGTAELVEGIDRLSAKLREEIGESLRSIRGEPSLAQVTTASLGALLLYAEADRVANREGFAEAIPLLERAVAEDSMFAMAWRRLGLFLSNPGQGAVRIARGDSALRRAHALRDRLPEKERLFVEAALASRAERGQDAAMAAYTAILSKYPLEPTALNNLAVGYSAQARSREALALYRQLIETGTAPALTFGNAILGASALGRFPEADSVLQQMSQAYPGSFDLAEAALMVAEDRQDFIAADSLAEKMLRGTPAERETAHQSRAVVAALRGRMSFASREYRNALRLQEAHRQLGSEDAAILHELSEIERVADYTADAAAATRRLDALWTRNTRLTAERRPLQRRHLDFAAVYARLGAARRARELISEHQRIMSPGGYPATGARARARLTAAAVTAAEGKPDSALAEIRDACSLLVEAFAMCQPLSLLAVAEAHDRAGRPDSAVAAYRRFAELKATRLIGPPGSLDMATPRIAPAWRRLGELLEAKGDRQAAIEAYQRFLEFWREADPELQPIVRQVRTRVDRLRRAAG